MSQPNILLITSDQQHYSTLGVTNPRIQTPALDRLCREGTRFDRAYCPNPTCSPTRASIITGQYPSLHGCWAIGVKTPEDIPFVGDNFQQAGYASTLVGKAHFQPLKSAPGSESIECQPTLRDLEFWRGFHGPWYGFDHVETARMHSDEHLVGQHYAIWLEEHGLKNWRDYFRPFPINPDFKPPYWAGDKRHWKLPQELHHTNWIGERTIANIKQSAQQKKPFFLWSSFFDPHPPYIIPEPWASMYKPEDMVIENPLSPGEFDKMPPHFAKTQQEKPDFSMYQEPGGGSLHGFSSHLVPPDEMRKNIACYYGMISFMDQQIGLILDSLDEFGLAENTLVVFSTDHGHFYGQHGLTAKGAFHYEDMLRIPFIVRHPGKVPAGRASNSLQSLVDLAPTFLSAAGLKIPGHMQGVDQLPVWSGQKSEARDHVLVENRHNPTTVHLRTYINDRYKVTIYRKESYGELFDLVKDPMEKNNVWNDPAYKDIKVDLLHRFIQADLQTEHTRMPRVANA